MTRLTEILQSPANPFDLFLFLHISLDIFKVNIVQVLDDISVQIATGSCRRQTLNPVDAVIQVSKTWAFTSPKIFGNPWVLFDSVKMIGKRAATHTKTVIPQRHTRFVTTGAHNTKIPVWRHHHSPFLLFLLNPINSFHP